MNMVMKQIAKSPKAETQLQQTEDLIVLLMKRTKKCCKIETRTFAQLVTCKWHQYPYMY